jgi:hypothetical protein
MKPELRRRLERARARRAAIVWTLSTVCAAAVLLTAGMASAQVVFPPERMAFNPAALTAKVGAWSEYAIRQNGDAPEPLRVALVGRDERNLTFELRSPLPGYGSREPRKEMTIQLRLPIASGVPVQTTAIVQIDGLVPMTVTCQPTRAAFFRPTAKTMVGVAGAESIKVPAGQFRTNHHRIAQPYFDEPDELWFAPSVLPLGVVKVKNPPGILAIPHEDRPGPARLMIFAWPPGNEWELTATGTDASPAIAQPARPYDEAQLRKDLKSPEHRTKR